MILSALLKNYRIQEFIQFMSNVLMIVAKHGAENLKVEEANTELTQAQGELEEAYKRNRGSELTLLLATLDFRRDQAVKCLRQVSQGYTYHFDETFQAAGNTVVECIDKFGSAIYDFNYEAETAALKNLTVDLQTIAACMNAILKMNLTDVVGEMKASNEAFETTFVERLGEYSTDESKTTKELLEKAATAYRKLVKHVEAHVTLTPSDVYDDFIKHLNENIQHFNQIVENRKDDDDE